MISAVLIFIGGAAILIGALIVIFSNTGPQDTLGSALVLGGFVLGALGGLLLVAGM